MERIVVQIEEGLRDGTWNAGAGTVDRDSPVDSSIDKLDSKRVFEEVPTKLA